MIVLMQKNYMNQVLDIRVFFIISGLLFMTTYLAGQNGSVRGTVYDSAGNETLIGANVTLASDVSIGVATELDGSYLLENLPAGPQMPSIVAVVKDRKW